MANGRLTITASLVAVRWILMPSRQSRGASIDFRPTVRLQTGSRPEFDRRAIDGAEGDAKRILTSGPRLLRMGRSLPTRMTFGPLDRSASHFNWPRAGENRTRQRSPDTIVTFRRIVQ